MQNRTHRSKVRLRWLEGKRARHRSNWLGYNVTIFNTRGQYPEGTYKVPGGVFHADSEIAFSVVWGGSWERLDADLPYSEIRGLSPDCLRLVASLMLCERRGGPRCTFYPETGSSLRIDARRLRLDRDDVIDEIRQFMLQEVSGQSDENRRKLTYQPKRMYQLLAPSQLMVGRLREFWDTFDPVNYIILRGMHALMKADMLFHHRQFQEEATIACFIALDASFSMIQQELVDAGSRTPSAGDVTKWVYTNFNEAFGLPMPGPEDRYFGEAYEQRVMTLHPSSRYGETPIAPLAYDDFIWLSGDLRAIFAYLLTHRHGADYYDDLKEALRFRRRPA